MSAMGDKKLDKKRPHKSFQQKVVRTADYVQVDAERLRSAIAAAAGAGGALRFGYSRDGGVYAVGVLGDGDPYTLWCKDADELDITLESLREHFDDMARPSAKTAEPVK